MSYSVSGWIEIVWDHTISEKEQQWCSVIDLTIFDIGGDGISNYLFGLAKSPLPNALFSERGVPSDCSSYVDECIKENNRYMLKYGEGDFGHTYALWSEIIPHLDVLKKEEPLSEWLSVFTLVEKLSENQFRPEWIRFVVWGNW